MGVIFTQLASAVVVLGGIMALLKPIWHMSQSVRDNTRATKNLTEKLDGLQSLVDVRLTDHENRLRHLERKIR